MRTLCTRQQEKKAPLHLVFRKEPAKQLVQRFFPITPTSLHSPFQGCDLLSVHTCIIHLLNNTSKGKRHEGPVGSAFNQEKEKELFFKAQTVMFVYILLISLGFSIR